jgi:hypothetical protein
MNPCEVVDVDEGAVVAYFDTYNGLGTGEYCIGGSCVPARIR